MESITGYIVGLVFSILFIIAGFVGAILPILPATPLIFVGALIYGFVTDFNEITASFLVALAIITILAQTMDFLAGAYGAKKFGSSRWGIVGAIVGAILGIFIGGPIGLAIFPFVFAFLFELIAGAGTKKSLKSALGSLVGVLGGIVMQVIFAIVMVGIILIAVL